MVEESFPAYYYQKELQNLFEKGENFLIQAPTGAGKTRAALEPGLRGLGDHQFPQKILYAVPMRVLARGFQEQYSQLAKNPDKAWKAEWQPRIQTGEDSQDPLLEGRVIFATVDQILASFLNIPYGIPTKLDNINLGAVVGSYLIFDEFHLYPREEMMLTVVAMLKMLDGINRFTLMSATFSPALLQGLADLLGATPIYDAPGIRLEQGRFSDVTPIQTQKRTFYAETDSLDAQAVLERRGERTLVVCNTVEKAQKLYQDLRETDASLNNANCQLLHSQFYKLDRRAKEDFALTHFESPQEKYTGEPLLLIATQVIEVGLDITCDVLLTECAPAASLIQRAGRCARRKNEHGRVHIFQPYDDGQVNYAPYHDEGQADICHKTWDALNTPEFQGQVVRFPQEQRLVELAHSETDQALVEMLHHRLKKRIEEITMCMKDRDGSRASSLIRRNNQVQVYIHPTPNTDEQMTAAPWRYEGFNLSKGRLAYTYKEVWLNAEADVCLMAASPLSDTDPEGVYPKARFQWLPIGEAKDIYHPAFQRFCAHPDVVQYSFELGLQLHPGETSAPHSPMTSAPSYERPTYHAERYQEHITGLYWAYTRPPGISPQPYTSLQDEYAYALQKVCEVVGKDIEQAESLLRLTFALHDVGKLNIPWQNWTRAWRSAYAEANFFPPSEIDLDDPEPLAHSDFNSGDTLQRNAQKTLKHQPRGNHAVEGAQACDKLIQHVTNEDIFWRNIILTVIMHHHTPDAKESTKFEAVPTAPMAIEKALVACGFSLQEAKEWVAQIELSGKKDNLERHVKYIAPSRDKYQQFWMYALFVRILRLADQRSGTYWQRYKGY